MPTPFDAQAFASLVDRGVLQIGDGHRAKLSELGGDGPIFLRAGLISDDEIRLQGADRFRKDAPIPSTKFSAGRDTFVTTKGNSVGRTGYIPPDFPRVVYSPHLSYWRSLKPDSLHPEFLRYWARSPDFASQLHAMGHGTDMAPYLSLIDQKRLVIPLPLIGEQRAISAVLGALDDKIVMNQQVNATLQVLIAALYRALGALPGRDEWDRIPIGDAVSVVGGGTPSTSDSSYWAGGIHAWATPRDLSRLRTPVLVDTERHITDRGVERISSGLLPPGTVLLSSRAPVGYLAIAEVPVAINQGFIAMICNKNLPNYYVWQWTLENMIQIKGRANGTTFEEISKTSFRPMLIAVPPSRVLSEFRAVVTPLYRLLVATVRESWSLAELRDSLLPRLMSGHLHMSELAMAGEGAV